MTRNDLILQITNTAGDAIQALSPTEGIIDKEGRGNYVTAGDKRSEEILIGEIKKYFPEDTILSEETESLLSSQQLLATDHLWILDPIDGTANFRYRRKYSCVSVGYAEKGIMHLGVVYDPFRHELYTAEKGNGAFWNGEQIQCSSITDLSKSTVVTDNSYDPIIVRQHIETLLKMNPLPWIQMKGSAALELCEVASGQIDLMFSYCLKPWDNAAGFCILEEAGAVMRDRKNQPVNFLSEVVIAGNQKLVEGFIEAIR